MIKEVEGDILLTESRVIAHGVAANDPMSQGLALSIHQKVQAMHKDFHHWCHVHSPKGGEAWMWEGPDNVRIVNLITQTGGHAHGSSPGKATHGLVNKSLRALAKMAKEEQFESIALPRLATGVGGMQWAEVRPLITRHLGKLGIPVYVYVLFHAGKKAQEN